MKVRTFIERVRRQIYNGQPSDDATITIGLVKNYLPDAVAEAIKTSYKENLNVTGIGAINNSFYYRFSGLSISYDGNLTWKIQLPQIPVGVAENEGLSTLELVDGSTGEVSKPFVWLTERQKSFYQGMRIIPNKVLAYYEGSIVYAKSLLLLSLYTANIVMPSGGDFRLDSELNVPDDYYPLMMQYLQQQLLLEHSQPLDSSNDGEDFIKTV